MKPSPIDQLHRDLHVFVDEIVSYGDCPSKWPLTQQEQSNFVRWAIHRANKIRKTEAYQFESKKITLENLSVAS